MNPDIEKLVHELEQISCDKITQPNWKSRAACKRAADLIKELYANQKDTVDS